MMATMIALMKERRAPGATILDIEPPSPKPNEVLAKVKATSICGTDLHLYEWNKWAETVARPPNVLGHEFSAIVTETGSQVTSVRKGDLISAESHIYCTTCFQCKIGNLHLCENLKLRGVNTDGCFAEYVTAQEGTIWKINQSLSPDVASALEPFGNAVHAVYSGPVAGQSIVIFGCGPIGLCALKLCVLHGAYKVIVIDVSEYRLRMAERIGDRDTVLLNASSQNIISEVTRHLPNGADVVLEMSGARQAIEQSLKIVRRGGRVTLLGLPSKSVEIDLSNDVILKQVTLQGIFGRKIFETWETACRLAAKSSINLNQIITHKLKLEEYEEAFDLMRRGQCGKIILRV
jgi:threonine 3-dehydrogenase